VVCIALSAPLAAQASHLATQARVVVKPDMPRVAEVLAQHMVDGDAVATGPYVFFDFLYSFHAEAQISDWYQAGGAPRWVELEGHTARAPRRVLMSTSDIALPWEQLVTHAGLNRLWLVDVDERPYGLRELEGAGTIHAAALESAGLVPCESPPHLGGDLPVRCYQVTPVEALKDTLRIGREDFRQVMGLAPPGGVRSYVRRLAPSGALLFGAGQPVKSLELDVLRWLDEDVTLEITVLAGEHAETTTVTLTKRRQTFEVPIGVGGDAARGPVRVEITPSDELVERRGACFRHRRERYRRGRLDCGIYLREARLRRSSAP
jgi:hypothetical protein